MNLVPGLYKFTGTASITGSDVTLTGGPDDVWIFQIAAELQVGSMIQVILAGGAQARNIFWQTVGSVVCRLSGQRMSVRRRGRRESDHFGNKA